MKLNYKEGTWFAIPLRSSGFAVGVVARAKRGIILCYAFGPHRDTVPALAGISHLKAKDAVRVFRVGDLHLITLKWPIIGQTKNWNHSEWPMPVFIRRGMLPPYTNFLVFFSDEDPTKRIREEREQNDRPDLPEDSLKGAGAAEITLTKVIKPDGNQ
jgi:Immunity protein 26